MQDVYGICEIVRPPLCTTDEEVAQGASETRDNDSYVSHAVHTGSFCFPWKEEELHPAQASILGYNRNKGHEISLRLRTDRLDGFRMYSSLRDVLIHELAHMTHSEHNSQFHALNRELTKEIALPTVGGVHRLGGGQLAVANEAAPDGHTSRQVLAAAALLRLTAKEEHITGGCSTSD
ncbi:hypothetical protein BASA60_006290 [Batrachochytrium salamandrivorans]|nr:hypothetical protein BASA60_006290 [Batrachochytrium salamandrivorans]